VVEIEAGDMQAIKELADRLDGRPAQILEHNPADSEPITKIVRDRGLSRREHCHNCRCQLKARRPASAKRFVYLIETY
jgi:hypothetical protein